MHYSPLNVPLSILSMPQSFSESSDSSWSSVKFLGPRLELVNLFWLSIITVVLFESRTGMEVTEPGGQLTWPAIHMHSGGQLHKHLLMVVVHTSKKI